MKKITFLYLLVLAASGGNAQEITGDWSGFLTVRGDQLKIVFHIRQNDGKLTSTFDSPDQNAIGLRIEETTLTGNELSMKAGSLGIAILGIVSHAEDSINGSWIQGGGKLPLVLTRAKQAETGKTANTFETDIVLKTTSGDILGTLTMPGRSSGVPVVLIIAGSGPTDRDGNSPPAMKNRSNCYKLLAEELRKKGIASVRYDKRGIAGSLAAMTKESDLRFENYIADAKAWIENLGQDKRFSKIIVAGHSEGSLIGMIACNQARVNGYVSIAGSGRPAAEIMKEQLCNLPQEVKDRVFLMLDKLNNGDTIADVPNAMYSLFRPGIQPYLISWFRYDPRAEIKKLAVPVMIIQGDMDIQVSVADAALLSKADPKAVLKIISHMNHVLKDTDTKVKNEQVEKVYTNGDLPLDKLFTDEMVKFTRKVK